MEKLWDKYLTDENDKEVSLDALTPFLAELKEVLMSEEYNYTEEQYQELIQKALIECPKDIVNQERVILIKLNFKEFVSIVKELIENPEEHEEPKSPVDEILDKYDTDEYDSLINVKDAAVTILEIMNELSPVLQSEYGMTSSEINELFQTVYNNNLMCRIDSDETFINIRIFVENLREAIANFEPSEPVDNRTDLEKFVDRIESDEFDKTVSKEEVLNYINEFRDLLMADFVENRGYSEEYSNFMFDFILKEMSMKNEVNLKDVLKEFYSNTQKLTSNPYSSFNQSSNCSLCSGLITLEPVNVVFNKTIFSSVLSFLLLSDFSFFKFCTSNLRTLKKLVDISLFPLSI